MNLRLRWLNFLDWLLGPRCPRCSERVFPNDQNVHNIDCD